MVKERQYYRHVAVFGKSAWLGRRVDSAESYSSGVFHFSAPLWLYQGADPWHFLTLPSELGEEIRSLTSGDGGAFGQVKVEATIGDTTWSTSLFPDKDTGGYLLPVKRAIREGERLQEGDMVSVALDVARGS